MSTSGKNYLLIFPSEKVKETMRTREREREREREKESFKTYWREKLFERLLTHILIVSCVMVQRHLISNIETAVSLSLPLFFPLILSFSLSLFNWDFILLNVLFT